MTDINTNNLALVITDPQNDFLSPEGVTWGVVGDSVTPDLGDGYAAAVTNFGFVANGVLTAADAAAAIA